MTQLFIQLLNMSITASWLTLAIVLLRFILKKAPKAIICSLWALVAVRLIFPVSLESIFSLVPSKETVPTDILYTDTPVLNTGLPVLNNAINPVLSQSMAPASGDSVNPMQIAALIATIIWLVGVGIMVLYTLVSYLRLKYLTREALRNSDNLWICDHISSPFILGIFRPRIYLPSALDHADISFVITHEQAHLHRRDHWWKPLGFALLTIYWFNPVLWLAYVLLCRDIELACDERVIRQLGIDIKKPYSQALINCSIQRRMISACPLAFGEGSIKGRIRSVLHYKKPAFWIIITTLILSLTVTICFLTDPPESDPQSSSADTDTVTVSLGSGMASNVIWGPITLSSEDACIVADILASPAEESNWLDGVTRDLCYYVFTVNGRSYSYADQASLFNDYENDSCLYLSEADQAAIDSIIEKYLAAAYPSNGPDISVTDPRAYLYFYPQPSGLNAEKVLSIDSFLRFAILAEESYRYLETTICRDGWVATAQNPNSFRYDGQFRLGSDNTGNWYYFSFENQILYCNGKYLQLTNGDISFFRQILSQSHQVSNLFHSKDNLGPAETAYPYFSLSDGSFQLGYSVLSYAVFGTYFFDGTELTLTNEHYRYVFEYNGSGFVYKESRSVPCDNFPFKDGSVFCLYDFLTE